MMYKEFIEMSNVEVSYKDYADIIEPMYMATAMSKQEFINFIKPSAKELVKKYARPKTFKKMLVRDRSGCAKTPNGCWYHIEYVEFVGVDIKTGKYYIAPLNDEDFDILRNEGKDLEKSTDYDFDYTSCIDNKTKKPIELFFED